NQYRYVCYVKTPEGSSCPKVTEKIVMKNGEEKMIGELKDGDEVLTIDPNTFEVTPSKIYNYFTKHSDDIVKITAKDKSITCTSDHHFVTKRGWIEAKDLDVESDQLVIYEDKNCTWVPISTIEKEEPCMVSDFTTEHENHSMISSNFVTHNCGLIKNLTITTKLSLNRGIEGDRIISSFLTTTVDKTVVNQHIVLLNGKFMGWCQGEETRKTLINARREGEIYYDTSIFIDDRYLIIDASPSRLLSPVLIVDEASQRLVIDVKKITDLNQGNLIETRSMAHISE